MNRFAKFSTKRCIKGLCYSQLFKYRNIVAIKGFLWTKIALPITLSSFISIAAFTAFGNVWVGATDTPKAKRNINELNALAGFILCANGYLIYKSGSNSVVNFKEVCKVVSVMNTMIENKIK